jgi:hypothetical protein
MITLKGLHCTWKYLFYLEAWPSDWLDRFLSERRRCWIRPRSWACASWSSSGLSPSPGCCSRTKRRRKSRGGWRQCRWLRQWSKIEKQYKYGRTLKKTERQSKKTKNKVDCVNVDDHVNGLKLRNKTTQISFLKKTERQSKNKQKKVDCVNINDHINHFQHANDKWFRSLFLKDSCFYLPGKLAFDNENGRCLF